MCGVRRAVEWTAGMRDSQTEMEMQSKAAEETELVSRQRGEVEGGRVDGGSRQKECRDEKLNGEIRRVKVDQEK